MLVLLVARPKLDKQSKRRQKIERIICKDMLLSHDSTLIVNIMSLNGITTFTWKHTYPSTPFRFSSFEISYDWPTQHTISTVSIKTSQSQQERFLHNDGWDASSKTYIKRPLHNYLCFLWFKAFISLTPLSYLWSSGFEILNRITRVESCARKDLKIHHAPIKLLSAKFKNAFT